MKRQKIKPIVKPFEGAKRFSYSRLDGGKKKFKTQHTLTQKDLEKRWREFINTALSSLYENAKELQEAFWAERLYKRKIKAHRPKNLTVTPAQKAINDTRAQIADYEAKMAAMEAKMKAMEAANNRLETKAIQKTEPLEVVEKVRPEVVKRRVVKTSIKASASARSLAARNGIDLRTVTGTGKNGTIKKSDIQAIVDQLG